MTDASHHHPVGQAARRTEQLPITHHQERRPMLPGRPRTKCRCRRRSCEPPPLPKSRADKWARCSALQRSLVGTEEQFEGFSEQQEIAREGRPSPNRANPVGKMEAPPGFEPGMEVLQTSALPLGYGAAVCSSRGFGGRRSREKMERETGFEPATSTLARSHSTTELFPLALATNGKRSTGVTRLASRRTPPGRLELPANAAA